MITNPKHLKKLQTNLNTKFILLTGIRESKSKRFSCSSHQD